MWIKICGVCDLDDALETARLGVDAVGLNFFDGSPRRVATETAARIVEALPAGVEPVGVFVNASASRIVEVCRRTGLRTVQLHGDEPPELLAQLAADAAGLRVIRAHRMDSEGLGRLDEWLQAGERRGVRPWACLLDARVEGLYGGSGRTLPWRDVADEYRREEWPPLILAGGLTPGNVVEAAAAARPWGVDVAGGVESAAGRKDLRLVQQFVEAARGLTM